MVSNYPNVYNGINVFIALEERRGEEEVAGGGKGRTPTFQHLSQ